MRRRVLLALGLLGACAGFAGHVVEERGVNAAGGGAADAGPYLLVDTIGQAAVGSSSSSSYSLAHGFWNPIESGSLPTAASLLSFRAVRDGSVSVTLHLDYRGRVQTCLLSTSSVSTQPGSGRASTPA